MQNFTSMLAPLMWSLVFVSSLMLLSVYDAHTFLVSFVLITIGVFGALMALPKGQMNLTLSPMLILVMLFWAVALISALLSKSSFTSFIFFCFLGMLPLSFFYTLLVQQKDSFFQSIYKVGLGLYAFLSVISLVQYFYVPAFLPYGLTQYPFGNPNSLAGYLSLGFFAVYGGFIASKKPAHRQINFAVALLILVAMCTTGSRGALLCLLGGVAFMIVMLRKHIALQKTEHAAFWGLFIVSFFGLSFLAPAANQQTPVDVVVTSISGDMPLLWDRPFLWASTWEIIKDHFWTGTGVGTFVHVYPAYRAGDIGTAGHMAHNDLLQFWAEMGVLGPILFLSIAGYAVYKTFSVLTKIPLDNAQRIHIIAPFCALGAMLIHTQISFHFYVLPTLFVTGTLLAYWLWQIEKHAPSKTLKITTGEAIESAIVKLCLGFVLICCLGMLVRFQLSEIATNQAKKYIFAGDMQRFVQLINQAGELSFKRNPRASAMASTVPSGAVQANAASMKQDDIFKALIQAEKLLDQSLRNNIYLASSYHEKAVVAELGLKYVPAQYSAHHNGNPPDMRALMEKAFYFNPLHAGTRIKLAEMMVRDGEEDEAYALLKEGMVWQYRGTKGMRLFETIAAQALQRGDIETRDRALRKIATVHALAKKIEKRESEIIERIGPLWGYIKNR